MELFTPVICCCFFLAAQLKISGILSSWLTQKLADFSERNGKGRRYWRGELVMLFWWFLITFRLYREEILKIVQLFWLRLVSSKPGICPSFSFFVHSIDIISVNVHIQYVLILKIHNSSDFRRCELDLQKRLRSIDIINTVSLLIWYNYYSITIISLQLVDFLNVTTLVFKTVIRCKPGSTIQVDETVRRMLQFF